MQEYALLSSAIASDDEREKNIFRVVRLFLPGFDVLHRTNNTDQHCNRQSKCGEFRRIVAVISHPSTIIT